MSSEKSLSINLDALRVALLQRESSGNYGAINRLGFVGGYQMGDEALEEVGLLRKGASGRGNAALRNPNNWTIPGGLETFLNSPQLQDKAFKQYALVNYKRLRSSGVIDDESDSGYIAGALASAHLKGVGGAKRLLLQNQDNSDANGVPASEYFSLGESSQRAQRALPAATNEESNLPAVITRDGSPSEPEAGVLLEEELPSPALPSTPEERERSRASYVAQDLMGLFGSPFGG